MEGFFGFITIVGFLYLAMLLISKTTNMSIKSKYQSGSAIDPGDLDNLIDKSRRVIDKNYKDKKIKEEILIESYRAIQNQIDNEIRTYNMLKTTCEAVNNDKDKSSINIFLKDSENKTSELVKRRNEILMEINLSQKNSGS